MKTWCKIDKEVTNFELKDNELDTYSCQKCGVIFDGEILRRNADEMLAG